MATGSLVRLLRSESTDELLKLLGVAYSGTAPINNNDDVIAVIEAELLRRGVQAKPREAI